MTISEDLARWAIESKERGFADADLESAQTYVLDWIASALAGRGTPPGHAVLRYTEEQPAGGARILGGRDGRRSAEAAAFANGALSHIVEMDDVDRVSVVHPGAVVIPAALAIADRDDRRGREFLSAVMAGYEVAIRFGSSVGKKHYYHFHNTSTCGVFGAAMAAGWLLDLNEEQLAWTLGNAGTTSFGLWEFNTDGAMSKHLHTGHAASNGVRAADLAANGFTGARSIVEGERGFFAGLAPEGDPARVTAKLGEAPLALPGVSLKPYASCRHTHAAIDAAFALRQKLDGRAVQSGQVGVYRAAKNLCDKPRPRTPYEAKFSLQYCVSRALEGRAMGLDDFDAISERPEPLPLEVVVDRELDTRFPEQFPARVALTAADGETLTEEVAYPLGDPENPLSRKRVEEKLRTLASYGGVDDELARGYLEWVSGLARETTATRI